MLCGNEESVYKQFEEDDLERKFLKEKAVTLTIQLKAKRYYKIVTLEFQVSR